MLTETLNRLFQRDLEKLKSEINLYQNEENLWLTQSNISNSAGNLCLHLLGNLNAFIGAALGKTGYIRQRDLEFSLKNVPKAELIVQLEHTMKVIETTLSVLTESKLQEDFPIEVFQEKTSNEFMLVHLTTHLAYHLGQINYHRRLLDN